MYELEGKVAVITGAARGLGADFARLFVAEGASVLLTDILVEEGEAVAVGLGDRAMFLPHDVTDSQRWDEVVAKGESAFGPINVLVNNAGMNSSVPLDEMTEEHYRRVVDVNQVSVFLGMKAVLASMRRAGGGSIVNISSAAGIVAAPTTIAYSASKFAVRGMSKAAAAELAVDGIRVNSVHPGYIRTPMTADIPEASAESARRAIPLGRFAQPAEVSNLVLYLASDKSSFSTGSEFVVDGGYTAQ